MARRSVARRLLGYPIEAAVVWLATALFGALAIDRASALGGWLGRVLGPRLGRSRVAERNLRRAFPERAPAEVAAFVRAMWDNLGRVVAEFPHLGEIDVYADGGRVETVGAEHLDALRAAGASAIFFSAHLGNWEIASLCTSQKGMALTFIYRVANNPFIERLVRKMRTPIAGDHFPKGAQGAARLVAALRRGESVGMLVDQKLSRGIAAPFFGRDAMTAPTPALFAHKFGCPLVPVRVERLEGARFRVTIYPPMDVPDTGDREADVAATTARINAVIEEWIRARPEQWLWIHRRWPE